MTSLFGVTIQPLNVEHRSSEKRILALRYEDHLLRRFGVVEIIELAGDKSPHLRLRRAADEILIIVEGSIALHLVDHRSASPTLGQPDTVKLHAPARALIPFGVAAGWKVLEGPIQLIRMATHSEDESPVQHLDWKQV